MEDNQCEEMLFVEDSSDLLGLSIKTLRENGHADIFITHESEDVFGCASRANGYGKNDNLLDMNFLLIYTKPKLNKNTGVELLRINSELEVIPLVLLVGRTKDMDIIADHLPNAYRYSKQPVNLRRFMEKIRKMPIFWGMIQTDTPDTLSYEKTDEPVVFVRV